MPRKKAGLKVSVEKDLGGEVAEEPKKKKSVAKKLAVKKVAAKKPAKKVVAKQTQAVAKKEKDIKEAKPEKKKTGRKKRGIVSIFLSVFMTAAIVGGAIYAWQQKEVQKEVEEVESKSEVAKMDFEKRISNLKSKLTGTETSNVELKKTLEDLKKQASLLIGSKKEFSSDLWDVRFDYPASFGLTTIATSTVASGTKALASFENNEKFVFSAVTENYEKDSTSTVDLWELKGYAEKRDKYYLLGPNEDQEYEINPAKIISTDIGNALLIDKNSFVLEEGTDGLPVDIGGDVAVVFNLEDEDYSAMIFVDSDFGMLSLEDFVKLVESIN